MFCFGLGALFSLAHHEIKGNPNSFSWSNLTHTQIDLLPDPMIVKQNLSVIPKQAIPATTQTLGLAQCLVLSVGTFKEMQ